jgi:hypothetical protein
VPGPMLPPTRPCRTGPYRRPRGGGKSKQPKFPQPTPRPLPLTPAGEGPSPASCPAATNRRSPLLPLRLATRRRSPPN